MASAREGAQSFIGLTVELPVTVLLAPFLFAKGQKVEKLMFHNLGEIIVKIFGYLLLIICVSFVVAIIESIIEDKQKEKKLRERWKNDHKWR